ncbi:hypothetical protein [Gelidibacter gilvus]|uniref:CPBP family intramembrane metalloprotease n=1 Tax=Gelidibacter gilvus TaxID=59602 RepID=A0A4Q0XH81_9FLAO|nr:hypothetical protein [Gelidibacter gilvus]RXJ49667.1 hypothetical protein ESZ48_11730 [Gelidibacter gilvus]
MKEFIRKYELWIFLVLAPIFNTVLVLVTSSGLIPQFVYTHGRFYFLLLLLIIIVKYNRGYSGIIEMFRPILNWRVKPKWYLFSFFFIISLVTITLLLKSFYTGINFTSIFKVSFSNLSFRGFIVIFLWAFVGEVIWVSYSIRELTKNINPFYASQIVGFFWALWWVPVVFLNVGVILDVPVLPSMLIILASAGMCTIVYGHTKSGICVLILQFVLNLSLIVLPISPRNGGSETYTAFAILYFISMLLFMYFMNPIKNNKMVEVSALASSIKLCTKA